MIEILRAKKSELESKLNESTINEEEIEEKVAQYRDVLYKEAVQADNEAKKTLSSNIKLLDELIGESEAKATENCEQSTEAVGL